MGVVVVGGSGSPGVAGRQEGGGRTYHIPPHLLPPGLPPNLLDQQEDQMRVIIERYSIIKCVCVDVYHFLFIYVDKE